MRLGFPSAGFGFPSGWLGFPSGWLGFPSAQLGNPSSQPGGAAASRIALCSREKCLHRSCALVKMTVIKCQPSLLDVRNPLKSHDSHCRLTRQIIFNGVIEGLKRKAAGLTNAQAKVSLESLGRSFDIWCTIGVSRQHFDVTGDSGRTRTCDLPLRRRLPDRNKT
jgi:hypothetical protein